MKQIIHLHPALQDMLLYPVVPEELLNVIFPGWYQGILAARSGSWLANSMQAGKQAVTSTSSNHFSGTMLAHWSPGMLSIAVSAPGSPRDDPGASPGDDFLNNSNSPIFLFSSLFIFQTFSPSLAVPSVSLILLLLAVTQHPAASSSVPMLLNISGSYPKTTWTSWAILL